MQVTSNYGKYAYTLTVNGGFNGNQLVLFLAKEGLASLGYRLISSALDKWHREAGRLHKENKRGDIGYTDDLARESEEIAMGALAKLAEREGWHEDAITFVVTGEHVQTERENAMAMAERFVKTLLQVGQRETLVATLGALSGKDASKLDDAGLIVLAHEHKLGVRADKKAK